MKIIKSKPKSVLFLFFIFYFAVVCLHADAGKRSLFARYSGLATVGQSPAGWRIARNEQILRPGFGPKPGNSAVTILAGFAGNVIGMYAGAYLGSLVPIDGESWPFSSPAILGGLVGSSCGSALGVYLAGRSNGPGGNFGAALAGSLLGEVAAFVLALVIRTDEFPFLTGFLILPPIGAALVFNGSRRYRSSRMGSGILNLEAGKLGLGVPDVHIRPVMVPDGRAKTEMQFNVRVLSVEI